MLDIMKNKEKGVEVKVPVDFKGCIALAEEIIHYAKLTEEKRKQSDNHRFRQVLMTMKKMATPFKNMSLEFNSILKQEKLNKQNNVDK